MHNILFITPVSIAGTLIINGLAKGFEKLGHNVLTFDVRNLEETAIKEFNPDYVIGYDYLHLVDKQAELIISNLNVPVIHYFADDPNSNFAHSGNLDLFSKLSDSNGIVFCWDKQYLNTFKNKTFYLPLGVDPDLYSFKVDNSSSGLDIVFTGRPLTIKRQKILSEIVKNFPGKLNIFSYKKHFDTSVEEIKELGLLNQDELEGYKNSYKGFLETEQELAQVYANSKIILNITMDQGLSSMNYRIPETLASGGFLITDFKQDIADYFEEDRDLVFYRDNFELIEKINKYLNNESQRVNIADSGRNKVLKFHTFKQRAEQLLKDIASINAAATLHY